LEKISSKLGRERGRGGEGERERVAQANKYQ